MKTGVVAFLDILGFKGIWVNRAPDKVLEIVSGVEQQVLGGYKRFGFPASMTPTVTMLSDTIVIAMESEHSVGVLGLAQAVHEVMAYFFAERLFVRGAIGWGQFISKRNTFIGPVIDDVAAWYEKADWIGVITTPRTNYCVDGYKEHRVRDRGYSIDHFVKYPVPGKNDTTFILNALNWPGLLQLQCLTLSAEKSKSLTARGYMEKMFSEQIDPFDAAVLTKYENTLKFVDEAVSKGFHIDTPEGPS